MEENFAKHTVTAPDTKAVLGICRLAAQGDDTARRKLMELLFDRIYKTATYLTNNAEDAEDVTQMACIEILASAGSFCGNSSIQYWADRITFFTVSKIMKKRIRRQRLTDAFFQPPPVLLDADDLVGRAQVRNRVSLLIRKLKYNQREVLLLRYVHGYTIVEAAELCRVPVETARGRLKKGRASLKKKVLNDPLLLEWIEEWMQQ